MKIMKPFNYLMYLLVILLIVIIGFDNTVCFCGQNPIRTKDLVETSTSTLLTTCNITIKGLTGASYCLESNLHMVNQEFINNLVIKNISGLELNLNDVTNAYRHMFLSFRLNEFELYLKNELKEEYNKKFQKYYDNFIISMFLTKESLSYIARDKLTIDKIANFQLRDSLLSGSKTPQFLGAVSQVYQSNDFNTIITLFNDIDKLKKITNNQGLVTLMNDFNTTVEQNYLIYNTIGDLYSIVQQKGLDKLKNFFSLNSFEFGEKKKILLEKDIISLDKSSENIKKSIKKYFELVFEIEEKK